MYFTSTGNWSDVDDLGELNQAGFRSKSSFEKQKIIVFLVLLVLASIVLFWSGGFNVGMYVIIVIIGGFLAVFNYMSKSLSLKFKIPYSKVSAIELREQSVDIVFLDYNSKEETHHFEGLYSKGIDLFATVSDHYISKGPTDDQLDKTQWEI